ncbi:MAG: hypothetical protein ACYCTG_13345 [Ferrimicrobium sp.]
MTGLLLAETKKLFSTKLWWALGIPVVVFSGLGALPHVLTPAPVTSTSPLLHGAGDASLFVVAFAAMLFTSEFRYGTIISTVLAAPRRFDIVVSKALIGAVAGLLYGSIATIVTFVTGIIALTLNGKAVPGTHNVFLIVGGGLLASALLGAFAACIGGAVRNQIAALVALFVVLFVLSGLVTGLSVGPNMSRVPRFLPTNLVTSLSGGVPHIKVPPGVHVFVPLYFSFWPALGIFIVYVALSGLLAWWSLQRDIR